MLCNRPFSVAFALLATVACQTHEAIQTRPAESLGLRRYLGDGFAFDYPADATLKPGRNFADAGVDLYLLGSNLTLRADTGSRKRGYSVYSLELLTFQNPHGVTALEWANARFARVH